jgi:hypothetical protein
VEGDEMTSIFRKSITAAAALLGLALSAQSHANLIIVANGVNEANVATNTTANFSGVVGGFNVNTITLAGTAVLAPGDLFDVGTLDISTAGSGSLSLMLTETNLTGPSALTFLSTFSATLTNANVTRTFFLDTTNAGLETISLGSTTLADQSFLSALISLPGMFSISEQIDVTATGAGAKLSGDDAVNASVPEPASVGLFGLALAAVGFIRRRKRH